MIKFRILLLLILLNSPSIFAGVTKKILFQTTFGKDSTQFRYQLNTEMGSSLSDSGFGLPEILGYDQGALFLMDEKLKKVDLNKKSIAILNGIYNKKFLDEIVLKHGECITLFSSMSIYNNLTDSLYSINKKNSLNELQYAISYGNQIIIYQINKSNKSIDIPEFVVFDVKKSGLLIVKESNLKDSIELLYSGSSKQSEAIYLKNKKIVISNDFIFLREFTKNKYRELNGGQDFDEKNIFRVPDSSDSPEANNIGIGDFLKYDSKYNNYWIGWVPDTLQPGTERQAIFIYNSFGKLLNWFFLPLPPINWHYGAQVFVTDDGRIISCHWNIKEGVQFYDVHSAGC